VSEDWRTRSACAGIEDKNLPFRKPDSTEVQAFIADYCTDCPVVSECLLFGLRLEADLGTAALRHGVYGGLTGPERGRLLRFGSRLCSRCRRPFVPAREVSVRCQGCVRPSTVANPSPVNQHGSRAGYEQHRRRGEAPCWSCREAKARYEKWWRARSRGVA
jgi:hypothetical protein